MKANDADFAALVVRQAPAVPYLLDAARALNARDKP
jgi:hypothetical protein